MAQTATVVLEKPTVSFSTLAKVMGALSPLALVSRLRAHKYPHEGPKRSYQKAVRQAVDHLVLGSLIDPAAPGLRAHEEEALSALAKMNTSLPLGVTARRPSTHGPTWNLGGVTISMFPDAELESAGASGAIKFSFSKDRLARGVGATMAALVWHYRHNVLERLNVRPTLCLVCEPRVGTFYKPGSNPWSQVKSARVACDLIAAVWPML
jgi:hypothetical protein